jgi:hypothetical protein
MNFMVNEPIFIKGKAYEVGEQVFIENPDEYKYMLAKKMIAKTELKAEANAKAESPESPDYHLVLKGFKQGGVNYGKGHVLPFGDELEADVIGQLLADDKIIWPILVDADGTPVLDGDGDHQMLEDAADAEDGGDAV